MFHNITMCVQISGKDVFGINYAKLNEYMQYQANDKSILININRDASHPTVVDGLLNIGCYELNLESFGCSLNPKELIEEWDGFDKFGVSLNDLVFHLIVPDIRSYLINSLSIQSTHFIQLPPDCFLVIEFVDLLKTCENIEGIEKKIKEYTDRFKSMLQKLNKRDRDYDKNIRQLKIDLASVISELFIGKTLRDFEYKIKFLSNGGPDIACNGKRIEVKRRIEPRSIYGGFTSKIDLATIALMQIWTLSRSSGIEKAFEKQDADIIFLDLTGAISGFLTAVESGVYGFDLTIESAIEGAFGNVEQTGGVIIAFYRSQGYNVFAKVFRRDELDNGKLIDKIRDNIKKSTGTDIQSEQMIKELSKYIY